MSTLALVDYQASYYRVTTSLKYIKKCLKAQLQAGQRFDWIDLWKNTDWLRGLNSKYSIFDDEHIYIKGPLPISKEYNRIIVVVDKFSKIAWYIPIIMNIMLKGVAKSLWEWVFKDTDIF